MAIDYLKSYKKFSVIKEVITYIKLYVPMIMYLVQIERVVPKDRRFGVAQKKEQQSGTES
jgi:hypothetical protein